MTEHTPATAGPRPSAAAAGTAELRRWRRRRMVWIVVTVVLAAVWVSSAWWGVMWISSDGTDNVFVSGMGIGVTVSDTPKRYWRGATPGFNFFIMPSPQFVWLPNYRNGSGGVPLWFLPLVAGAMSLRAWRRERRLRQRLADELCIRCGYELAGVPVGSNGVVLCPECGRAARL